MPTRLKKATYNTPGHAHFLTFSCFKGTPIFEDQLACQYFADSLDSSRKILNFKIWSYVIMPNHVHLLIHPNSDEYSISKILKYVKGTFAKRLLDHWKKNCPMKMKRLTVKSGNSTLFRVWERGGGFDRNLYSVERINAAINYIEENPVKRKLVADKLEWKWSSAKARLNYDDFPISCDEFKL